MKFVKEMLRTHPASSAKDYDVLSSCIEACFACEQACTACADACLHEEMVADLRLCIRTNLDCADVCATLGRAASRSSRPDAGLIKSLTQACLEACQACEEECRKHASKHEHCRVCADACNACESACTNALAATPA